MKIPKYVDEALRQRTRYALLLDKQCKIVDSFIERCGLEDVVPMEDWLTGVELYVNPLESEQVIRNILENAEI